MSKFVHPEYGFHVDEMCNALSQALKLDGQTISKETIKDILSEAAAEEDGIIFDAYLHPREMYIAYRLWMSRIGEYLGFHVDEDVFSWADGFHNAQEVNNQIADVVLKMLKDVDEQLKREKGFTMADVWVKSMSEDISPREAALLLESQNAKKH